MLNPSSITIASNNNNIIVTSPIGSNNTSHEQQQQHLLQSTAKMNESSNAESSFYEDQLDNELECIPVPPSNNAPAKITTNSSNNNNNGVSNNLQSNGFAQHNQAMNGMNGQAKYDEFANNRGGHVQYSNSMVNNTNNNNTAAVNGSASKPAKGKSGNHVSFNINNAIYTSRQETPIPISVLKQQAAAAAAAVSLSTNTNSGIYGQTSASSSATSGGQASRVNESIKPILVQNSAQVISYDPSSGESTASPLQSSLKKSSGISDLLSQYVQMNTEKDMLKQQQQQQQHQYHQQLLNNKSAMNNNNNNNNNISNNNSNLTKTDTKTTIL
jgi:hypothetical protein